MRPLPPCRAFARASLVVVLASACTADGALAQIDAIRRGAEKLRVPAPSLERLFGSGPAITSTLLDATDAVPSLDGFTPPAFSPLSEMPRGPGGTYLIAPGAYTFAGQSYCLKAGTYGPRPGGGGEGYLHAPLRGPKADVVSALIGRSADHLEIAQYDVQLLLWAIISRARLSAMPRSYQQTAARLLTPKELADVEGLSLSAVPAAIGQRVLRDAPASLRPILEAENELRHKFASASIAYDEAERVAVLAGVDEEPVGIVPEGRWSYHPSGFFIRYQPVHYLVTVAEIYYPEAFELRRDAAGRIISVSSPERRLDARYEKAPTVRFASRSRAASRTILRTLRYAARATEARPSEAAIWAGRAALPRIEVPSVRTARGPDRARRQALADMADLRALRQAIEATPARAAAWSTAGTMLQEAEHSALLRYYALRPRANPESGRKGAPQLKQYQPAGGAAMPGGSSRQIVGQSGAPARRDDPSSPTAKSRTATSALGHASTAVSAAANPASFFGGFLPSWMVGAGLDAAHNYSDQISDQMQGNQPGGDDAEDSLAPGSGPRLEGDLPAARTDDRTQDGDYRTFFRPRQVVLPRLAATVVPAERAVAINAALESTYRLATSLEAVLEAMRRRGQAIRAGNREWEFRQGHAEIYMKRGAGKAMVELSEALAALDQAGTAAPSESDVREAHARVRGTGIPAEALAVHRALGRSDEQLARYRDRLLDTDAREMSVTYQARLRDLRHALSEYGEVLLALPEVPAPW